MAEKDTVPSSPLNRSSSIKDLAQMRLASSSSVKNLREKEAIPMYQQERTEFGMPVELIVGEEVLEAKRRGVPVVALESTIFCHGLPYPQSVETALALEELIRGQGCVPATCAIIGGIPRVGLTSQEVEYLAKRGKDVIKVSRRDIPIVAARKQDGATTVCGTMMLAARANIPVFATGGIGGVHHGAELSFDVSADLKEFHRSSVCVVSAGAKAILDLPKVGTTLEVLETEGVPVVGYKTDFFPCFYSRQFRSEATGGEPLRVPYRADSAREVAEIIDQLLAEEGQGLILANPIPEEFEIPYEQISNSIKLALDTCKKDNIVGKEVTPYLLAQIADLTGGKTLAANIELVKNNVQVACDVAKALVEVRLQRKGKNETFRSPASVKIHRI